MALNLEVLEPRLLLTSDLDVWEPNDSFQTPLDVGALGRLELTDLAIGRNPDGTRDEDYFRFDLASKVKKGHGIWIDFDHASGDLDMALYGADGRLLRTADSVSDNEVITLKKLRPGTYTLGVYGYAGAMNDYDLLMIGPSVLGSTPPVPTPAPTPTPTPLPDPVPSPAPDPVGPATDGGFDITLSFMDSGLTLSQQGVLLQAAQRWEQVIVGDLPDVRLADGSVVDDLLIEVLTTRMDGADGILGAAWDPTVRSVGGLSYWGRIELDLADVSPLEAQGELFDLAVHEFGHILGIGTLWTSHGLLVNEGGRDPRFVGAAAVAEYRAAFGTWETSVPVENEGGSGSRDSHWRDSVFVNEVMSSFATFGPDPLSRITVASLADLGYSVNMDAADHYTQRAASESAPATDTFGGLLLGDGWFSLDPVDALLLQVG